MVGRPARAHIKGVGSPQRWLYWGETRPLSAKLLLMDLTCPVTYVTHVVDHDFPTA